MTDKSEQSVNYKVSIDHTFLRFNPSHSHFYSDIRREVPAFGEYNEHTRPIRLRLYAWIVCMYDLNSPLRLEIRDYYKRKVYAGKITGIAPSKVSGKYMEYVENIFLGKDEQVNKLIVQYIASFSSPEYMQLMAHIHLQHSMLNRIVANDADKSVQMMFDTATETIKKLIGVIYGSGQVDEVYEARRALYQQVSSDLSEMRPENVATTMVVDKRLSDDWNPYGGSYIPGEIHFIGDETEIAAEDERDL